MSSSKIAALLVTFMLLMTVEAWVMKPQQQQQLASLPFASVSFRAGLYCATPPSVTDNEHSNNDYKKKKIPIPRDMHYNRRNIQRQHEHFVALYQAGAPTHDVYVSRRRPSTTIDDNENNDNDTIHTLWFVGKLARLDDVSAPTAAFRQRNLICHHAQNLRPLDLLRTTARTEESIENDVLYQDDDDGLDVWLAPGDTEMRVAYNEPDLIMERLSRSSNSETLVKNTWIGFQGEIYQGGEEGFRTWRTWDGRPARPVVQGPAEDEIRPPTEEEMQEFLQGRNIQQAYADQQEEN